MAEPSAPRGGSDEHSPANGGERVMLSVPLPPADRDYLTRRADAEHGGDCSAALSRVIGEARTFRHDLRGKIGALDLIELCLASDAMTRQEAGELIAELRREFREMIDGATGES